MNCKLVTLALLISQVGFAESQYTHWINYTAANGMPDDKVTSVAIDHERVWAGTENGLVLLVGGRIERVFQPADGLAHRFVTGVAVDSKTGDVWISTFGGLSQYSGGHFHNYSSSSSGLANDIVYGVGLQGDNVWAATTAGISRLNVRTGEWTVFSERNAPLHEPWSYGISVSDKKVYVAVWGGGMLEFDIAGEYWKPYNDPDGEMEIVLFRNQGLIHDIVSSVSWNPDSKMVWASTYFGLSGYDGRNWHNYLSTDSGVASDFINAAKSVGPYVWACTDKGLSRLNFKDNTWETYRVNAQSGRGEIIMTDGNGKVTKRETPTALAHSYILNIDVQNDDIWVATAKGLSHGTISHKENESHANLRSQR